MDKRRGHGFTIIEVLIVLAIASLIMLMVFLVVPTAKEAQRKNQANKDLNFLVVAANTARQYRPTQLRLITGSNDSDGPCRPPSTMQSAACISNWQNVISKLGVLGVDITYLDTDPWGNPYALDENEGEYGPADCRLDTIRSAGPDSTFGTTDDINKQIPLRNNPCP